MVLENSFRISQLFLNVIYASGLKCYGSSQRRKFSNKLFCHRVPFPVLMKCAALSDLFLGHAVTMKEGLSLGTFQNIIIMNLNASRYCNATNTEGRKCQRVNIMLSQGPGESSENLFCTLCF